MKIDSNKDIALHGDWIALFVGLVMEQPTNVKLVVRQCWKMHLLRRQIKSERMVLATLGERELKDVGIERAEALIESKRNYGDVPSNRLN